MTTIISIIATLVSGVSLYLLTRVFAKVDATKEEARNAKEIAIREAFDQKISIEALVYAISELNGFKDKDIRNLYDERKETLRRTYEFVHQKK